MKALRIDKDKGPVFTDMHPKPTPKAGVALIRVSRAGICNTDLEIIKGYMGFVGVLGHEFLGIVEQVEDNPHISVGQRVVGDINLACNTCVLCQADGVFKRNHCKNRSVLGILNKDGAFAEYLTLPIANLHVVPEGLPDQVAVFAEPLAAAFRIVEQGLVKEGDSVAVVGDGKLGLLISEVMKLQNPSRLCLFGKHPAKMEKVSEKIEKVLVGKETEEEYKDVFDVCVEASGTPSGIMMAASITRCLGTIVLKSTCAAGSSSFNTAPFVIKELNVIGSRCGNFPMALEAMKKGFINPENLIEKVYPFQEALKAIKHAGEKGTLKIQLQF